MCIHYCIEYTLRKTITILISCLSRCFNLINIIISIAYRFSDVIKLLKLANIVASQGKNFLHFYIFKKYKNIKDQKMSPQGQGFWKLKILEYT